MTQCIPASLRQLCSQMHRPMDLSVVIVPVSESGAPESLQATGLWLGKQVITISLLCVPPAQGMSRCLTLLIASM